MVKNQSHMTTKMKPKDIFQIYQKIHKAVYDFCQSYRHPKISISHTSHFKMAV